MMYQDGTAPDGDAYDIVQLIKRDSMFLRLVPLFAMDKHSTALIDQLQSVHARQRKVIQQLQADSARLLSDLVEVRRERDAFRAEAAKLRKEQADLQNRLDETLSEYQDLKRDRFSPLSRAFSNASSFGRPLKVNNKVCTSDSSG
jgi:seryl-tRNA synthetase